MSPDGTVPLGTARLAVFLPFLVSLFLGTSLFRCPLLLAGPLTAHHDLQVSLFPESQRLVGFDRITVEPLTEAIVVELAPRVEVRSEKGSFLQAGAGWCPEVSGSRATFAVEKERQSESAARESCERSPTTANTVTSHSKMGKIRTKDFGPFRALP